MPRNTLLAVSLIAIAGLGAQGCGGTTTPAETFSVAYTIEMVDATCSSLQYDPGNGVLVTVNDPSSTWNKSITGLASGATVEIRATCSAVLGPTFPTVTVNQIGTGSIDGIVVDCTSGQTVGTDTVVFCEKQTLLPLAQ